MTTCIAVGAVSKTEQDISEAVLRMLRTAESEFPFKANLTLHLRKDFLESDSVKRLKESSLPASTTALATMRSCMDERPCTVIGDLRSNSCTVIGRIFGLEDASSSLVRRFENNYGETNNIGISAGRLLQALDGQYSLALKCGDAIFLARDPIGVKPLYIAENEELIAFSSRRKPLWELGLTECKTIVHPTLIIDREVKEIDLGERIEPLELDDSSTVGSLVFLLSNTLTKMAPRTGNKVAILFSGGLDSSIIAKLSKNLGIQCTLYCAGAPLSRDLVNARRMSSALDLPLVEAEITSDDVASHLLPVVNMIESADMMAVSTSLPIYFAVRASASDGKKVIFHGQGADEIFGGYERYEKMLTSRGSDALRGEMLNDIKKLGTAVPQCDHIGTMNSMQLLSPFLDLSVVRFSLKIPLRMKLFREKSKIIRKYILHKVASSIGIPTDLLPAQKIAAQFGSGVARILDKMARKAGYTKSTSRRTGFPLPVQAYLKHVGELAEIPPQLQSETLMERTGK